MYDWPEGRKETEIAQLSSSEMQTLQPMMAYAQAKFGIECRESLKATTDGTEKHHAYHAPSPLTLPSSTTHYSACMTMSPLAS